MPGGGYSTLVWVGVCLWEFWSATTHHPSMYQFWRKSDPSMYHGIWGQAHPCTTVYNFWPPIHVPVGKIHPWRYQNKAKITTHRGTSKKFRPMQVNQILLQATISHPPSSNRQVSDHEKTWFCLIWIPDLQQNRFQAYIIIPRVLFFCDSENCILTWPGEGFLRFVFG